MKKILGILSLVVIGGFLTACGGNEQNNNLPREPINNQEEASEKESNQPEEESETSEPVQSISFEQHPNFEPFDGKIDHIHGLGYAGDQNAIFFATHDGIKVYSNESWFKTKTENNDYMGFNAVEQGFFTSGHPGKDTSLPNPFGVLKSFDNGETLESLGLLGETDFHLLGVGYQSNVIYALPPNNNSKMKAGELYVSEDLAKTWEKVEAENLGENLFLIAAHPINPNLVAIAGEQGIYFSKDKGQSFELITEEMQGTSVYFDQENLWYGAFDGNPKLMKKSLKDESVLEVQLPELKNDAVMYLAQNPKNPLEIVFASFNGDIYLSKDGADSWKQLVKGGELQ
ncbi:hypothetical protein IM538_20670 [Cytobacillus suaedae]|nr:hypothetical protein IM538_20670 [Cytobacillus suaedae]